MYAELKIIGNVGKTPELRFTPNGMQVCNFSVAVNRRWTNANGQPQEQVSWFNVTAWQRQAEVCSQYLKKGDRVLVIAENISVNTWLDKEGAAQGSIEVVPRRVLFLSAKGESVELADESTEEEASANQPPSDMDDDMPF